MNSTDFNKIINKRVMTIKSTLASKGDEYAPGVDRLSNFKIAAILQKETPEEALLGMVAKHIVALCDFIKSHETRYDRYDEKLTDIINYCILLDGLLGEKK